ncbi:MAG: hypothetical protein HGA19_15070, partial [Oscillochloris sp.]|nr:hypothetical protein [Oscillochloris sp.]
VWDDPLPLQTTTASWNGSFFGIDSAPYAEDDRRKYFGSYNSDGVYESGLIDQLDQADYITLTSNRVYASTARLRMRYPALMNYYSTLFNGDLGFELVAEVTSYPNILGVEIPDQGAEEAFSVYDHPRVLIFKKTADYSRERAEELITQAVSWDEVYKLPVGVANHNPTALRLTASQWTHYTAGGTWASLYPGGMLAALAPLSWMLVLELLGLATFALLFWLLPGLPDRGFSLAKLLGLLIVAYLAWLLGSIDNGTGLPGMGGSADIDKLPLLPLPFTPGTLWLCAVPLLASGAYAAWHMRAALRAFGRERRKELLSAEGIFLGFLLLGLLLRWLNPDLWHPARGGEKPMDFAYLNAVLKSTAFPPYDPWHAGGYINYYYFGFVLVGALIHLSGAAPSVGYNLAVATLFGLTALGAWGIVYNLLGDKWHAAGRPDQTDKYTDRGEGIPEYRDGTSPPRVSKRLALIAAALAPALLLLLGNLAQAIWYISGYAAEQLPKNRPEWAFWDATRIVSGTVNEFPFFTFLFADLHAHMIVMPLSLALLGMGVAWVRQAADGTWRITDSKWQVATFLPAAVCLVLMGLLAGAIRTTNTWDYPTYVGLTALTVVWATFRAQRAAQRSPLISIVAGIVLAIAFVLAGNLLFLPFTANFATESSGVQLLSDGSISGLLSALLAVQRTSLWELIQLYGLWLFIATAAGLLLLRRLVGTLAATGTCLTLAAIALTGSLLGWPALSIILPMLVGGLWLLWQLYRLPVLRLLPMLWGTAAIGLLAMVELVVVKGDVGRMNTVFKFGLHSWTLFALSAAVALPQLWIGDRRQEATDSKHKPWGHWSAKIALALLIAAALVYPLTATPARLADRWNPDAPHTLDGAAFMDTISEARGGVGASLDEDAAAISWLQQHVQGTPVILEAHLPSYQWAGRISAFTGLPTILGWEWHQIQQRNVVNASSVIAARQMTVLNIYDSLDPQQAMDDLHRYGVAYLYVGGIERATYDAAGLAKFAKMVESGDLQVVFQRGQTTIYQVTHPGQPHMLTSDVPLEPPTENTPLPLMLREPVNEQTAVNEYAWNSLASNNSWLSLIFWLLAIYGLSILGLPVAHLVLGRTADGGWGMAKIIGLLLLGYAVWLPTSLGLWHYNAWGVLGGLALVLVIDGWALARLDQQMLDEYPNREHTDSPPWSVGSGLRLLIATLGKRWRALIHSEIIFLSGFAIMAGVRALNPDLWHPIWGGEKPMEFGFLNAILRSPTMPPY